MPPKKVENKRAQLITVRLPISTCSLVRVPEDALPGYEERIETGVQWNASEVGFRHHAAQFRREDLSDVTFREALQNVTDHSILGNMLRENSPLTLEEQFELMPMEEWDYEKFGTEEAKICFRSRNNITDNLQNIVREAVKKGGRQALKERLKSLTTLRLIGCKMTELDKKVSQFVELSLLNLCGNLLRAPLATLLPRALRALELQANGITALECMEGLPEKLVYLGLARNFLSDASGLEALRFSHVVVLDLSDNDICQLEPTVEALSELKSLTSLSLAGNPCSLCAAYAACVLARLPLRWLDGRAPLDEDRPPPDAADAAPPAPLHPDDLRSGHFVFTCYRVMSLPQPPKVEKGCTIAFHVELELPLLDGQRRQFLMYRRPESLTELLPEPEDAPSLTTSQASKIRRLKKGPSGTAVKRSKLTMDESKQSRLENSLEEEDIYNKLTAKNSREILHYTVFESNRVQWAKIINFQEPTIKIFCPDLVALRNTFRTDVTVRLVFTMTSSSKGGATSKKGAPSPGPAAGAGAGAGEQRCVLCSAVCGLRAPDWSRPMQDFHWDDSLQTDRAVHWGDGDLAVLQYNQASEKKPAKPVKHGADADTANPLRQVPPANLTCHFGFGVETLTDAMRR